MNYTTKLMAVAILGVTSYGQTANADTYSHLDNLALTIQRQAAEMYREFGAHYRHTPYYAHLRSDAASLYRTAAHVHEVAHDHGSVFHLNNDLKSLDRLFHHVEGLVDKLEHDAHFHGAGHVHGHTGHVKALLNSMENNIHHMQADVRTLMNLYYRSHHDHGHGHGTTIFSRPINRVPVYSGGHGGHGHSSHGHSSRRRGGIHVKIGNHGHFSFHP